MSNSRNPGKPLPSHPILVRHWHLLVIDHHSNIAYSFIHSNQPVAIPIQFVYDATDAYQPTYKYLYFTYFYLIWKIKLFLLFLLRIFQFSEFRRRYRSGADSSCSVSQTQAQISIEYVASRHGLHTWQRGVAATQQNRTVPYKKLFRLLWTPGVLFCTGTI